MKAPPTFFELFSGVGGMSMGLEVAGWHCVGHAEIEPHARAVTRYKWPSTPLKGDVSKLDGRALVREVGAFTMLTGGSPCQDLSVAGKRAGMTEGSGTRSALFFQQVRIWEESGAPYLLWENVLGAFSSNAGRDFAAVLSALVGATIAVPTDGWESGGVAAGRTGVAAWRVLDCQFFGPPQRRRRVFVLCARSGGVDPSEVLSLFEGLRGDFATGRTAGQGFAADVASRADGPDAGSDARRIIPIQEIGKRQSGTPQNGVGYGEPDDPMFTLQASAVHGVVALDGMNQKAHTVHHTLRGSKDGGDCVISFGAQNSEHQGDDVSEAVTPPLSTTKVPGVLALSQNHRGEVRTGAVMGALTTGGGTVGEGYPAIIRTYDARGNGEGDVVNTLTGEHSNRVTDFTPLVVLDKQSGHQEEDPVSPTLKTDLSHDMGPVVFTIQSFGEYADTGVASTIKTRDNKAATDLILGDAKALNISNGEPRIYDVMGTLQARESSGGTGSGMQMQAILAGRPRRLMPIECERLMGWADDHTAMGMLSGDELEHMIGSMIEELNPELQPMLDAAEQQELETDEQRDERIAEATLEIRRLKVLLKKVNAAGGGLVPYALSDSARYKLCGNGIASPVVAWIGLALDAALRQCDPHTALPYSSPLHSEQSATMIGI